MWRELSLPKASVAYIILINCARCEKKFLLLRLIAHTQLRLRVNSDFVCTHGRVHV